MDSHSVRLFCVSRTRRARSGRWTAGEAFYQDHAWRPPIQALLFVLVLVSAGIVAWIPT